MSSGATIINPLSKAQARVWAEYDLVVVCCDTATMMTPARLHFQRIKRSGALSSKLMLKAFSAKAQQRAEAGGGGGDGTAALPPVGVTAETGGLGPDLWAQIAAKKAISGQEASMATVDGQVRLQPCNLPSLQELWFFLAYLGGPFIDRFAPQHHWGFFLLLAGARSRSLDQST